MATIDDKVVSMSFESSKFESGVNKTIDAIGRLKKALSFQHQSQSMHGLATSAKAVDLGHISKGAEGVKAHLGAMNVAAVAIFANIASKAATTALGLAKAFTIDPAKAGFAEYTTNLNSIQTILANTQAAGSTLKDVNAALDELNDYSDKTIYNFGQMARNIGTFTAAGVDLKTATASIKGIANLAALSGSNSEQAATAMYQLSQAISSGSVKLMDWNSVVNAGMGGTVFQRALAQTGEHMGKLKKGTVQLVGPMKNVKIAGESFRNSLSAPGKDGWLTSDVLTKTLKMFTGDMTDAELAADGWNKAQIKTIQAQAKAAMLAATNVKTLSQVLTVAKETAGSGWAKTWRIVFGDFEEAKKTFTGLSNAINGVIIDNARARNNLLGDWKALGGRTVLINGIKTAFHNLGMILKPIKDAFRDVFPAKTGKDLLTLTYHFKHFAEALKPSEETVNNLKRTFRGLFAIFSIAGQIIGGVFTMFGKLFGAMDGGGSSFLSFTATIGDWLYALDQALKKGDRLNKFFGKIGSILAGVIRGFVIFKNAIGDLFGDGLDVSGFSADMSFVQTILEAIASLFGKLIELMGGTLDAFAPLINSLEMFFSELGTAVVKAASNMNFDAVLQIIRTGLFVGIFMMFKKFLGKGSGINQIFKVFGGGILANVSGTIGALGGSFKALTGSLNAMQQNLKAKTLKEIAIAVALLAVAVLAISMVDPERLSSSLSAITVMFGQLLGAMAILNKVAASAGFIKLPIVAASMILLAGAINVLAIAVLMLSSRSWEELAKGLGAVAVLMGILVVAAGPLAASSTGLIRAGVAMMLIAGAINILSMAVIALGLMDMATLAKGLGSIAVALVIIGAAMKLMPKSMILTGAGLLVVAVALNILAAAVLALGSMDLKTLGKGIGAIAASLVVIALAMKLMPLTIPITAAGLLLLAIALQGIASAVRIMGGMSLEDLGKGLGGLAGSLIILAGALHIMSGAIGGAIALGIAATGIALFVPALMLLSTLSWGSIIKGLVALAAAFAVIGLAGLLLAPVVLPLMGLGVALVLIGGGLALAGAGIALIGIGLKAIVTAGPAALGILLAALIEFQEGIVRVVKNTILGLLEIVKAFAEIAPQFVDSIVKIVESLIDVVIQLTPKLVEAFGVILTAIIGFLDEHKEEIIQAGFNLLIALLQGIRDNIAALTTLVVDIIVNFLNAINKSLNRIIAAGVQILLSIIKGIAKASIGIPLIAIQLIAKFLTAIASNIGKVAKAGLNIVTRFIKAIASGLGKLIKAGTDLIVGFIKGVGDAGPRIVTAATNAIIKFINALGKNGVKLARAGLQAIIDFLNGVAQAIEDKDKDLRDAGLRVGKAIVNGMTEGLVEAGKDLMRKAGKLASDLKEKLKKPWQIVNPSLVTKDIGTAIVEGLTRGISDHDDVLKAATAMSEGVITAVEDTFQITSPSKVMYKIGKNVIAGFAQGIKTGTEESIRGAFSTVAQKLAEQEVSLLSKIADAKKKRKELQKGKEDPKETAEINALNKALIRHNAALGAVNRRQADFGDIVKKNKGVLIGYAKQLVTLNENLEIAQGIFNSFKDQYTTLPEFIATDEEGNPVEDQLGAYTTALGKTITDTEKYAGTLARLKEMGLDDKTYEALLKAGPAAQTFASQLEAAGPAAVTALNAMNVRLNTIATTLGNSAAAALFDAGKEAAKGFVSGLTTEKENIQKLMDGIVDNMVGRLRKKLKSNSPSQVFAEIGIDAMKGMAQGLSNSSPIVTDAVDGVAKDALTAMEQSMRDISNVVVGELDMNPTITPILDLTQVKSKAAELEALTAATSYGQASTISSEQQRNAAEAEMIVASGGSSVKFEQNNYSPKALSDIEIYRQTKNQLSQLKSALALT